MVHALLYHLKDLSGIGGEERPGLVHRLDRETSGVLLVAQTDRARQHGAIQVKDAEELQMVIDRILGNRALAEELGRNALQVVRENLGAIERTVDMMVERLGNPEIYVAPQRVC